MKLLRVGLNQFLTYTDDHKHYCHGSIDLVANFMIMHGVKSNEIDYSVSEMARYDHNIAEFGVNGYFLFTDKQNLDKIINNL
jgi:hypothetical protein